jgi:hypothetical protein
MQTGLASRKLTFRDIFVAQLVPRRSALVRSRPEEYHGSMETIEMRSVVTTDEGSTNSAHRGPYPTDP